ncbi:hypothetical protein AOLI_G00002420 [Acnodon oligacanthus]
MGFANLRVALINKKGLHLYCQVPQQRRNCRDVSAKIQTAVNACGIEEPELLLFRAGIRHPRENKTSTSRQLH